MHGVEAGGVDCPAIDGILEEAEEVSGETLKPMQSFAKHSNAPPKANWVATKFLLCRWP
jgi:hypothetical protein